MRLMLSAMSATLLAGLGAAAGPRWPVELPIETEKNLPLAKLAVNGSHPLTFILDSAAAGCVLDRERAAAMGLAAPERAFSSGSGGTQAGGLVRGITLDAGGLELRPEYCFTFDMKSLKFRGTVEGILGMPLFAKYAVEIDYPGSRVRIFKPGSFRPSPKADVLPIRMTTGPVVRGSIRVRGREPIETDIQLDTGSAHVVTLCTPFVDRHKLLESAEEVTAGSTLGLGGSAADMVGRIEEVRIGRFSADKPLVRFSRQTAGSLASERHYSANLGGEFLKRYKVTFDIPGLRLYVED